MVAALLHALRRRGARARAPRPLPDERRRSALVAAIAALDVRHDAGDEALDPTEYAAQRAALKEQLAATLAAERAAE
jgi:hypothetical protein